MSRWHIVCLNVKNQSKTYTSLGKPLSDKEAKTFLSKMSQSLNVSFYPEKINNDICGITIGTPEYSEGWGTYRLQYRDICQKPIDHKDSCLLPA